MSIEVPAFLSWVNHLFAATKANSIEVEFTDWGSERDHAVQRTRWLNKAIVEASRYDRWADEMQVSHDSIQSFHPRSK